MQCKVIKSKTLNVMSKLHPSHSKCELQDTLKKKKSLQSKKSATLTISTEKPEDTNSKLHKKVQFKVCRPPDAD